MTYLSALHPTLGGAVGLTTLRSKGHRLVRRFGRPVIRFEAVGKSDEIRFLLRRGDCRLVVLDRLAGDPIELLELRQDPPAELQVVLADQAEAPAKLLIGGIHGRQVSLLNTDTVSQVVALGDELLDRRHAGESDAFYGLIGATVRNLGLGSRGDDLSQVFNHGNELLYGGKRG